MIKYDLITINYAAILGILFLLVFLWQNSRMNKVTKNKFYTLVFLEFVEMTVYSAELVTADLPQRTVWRTLFSIIGYLIRPFLIYIILLIWLRNDTDIKKKHFLAIPAIINVCIVSTSLFSPLCFSYSAGNLFIRGPLAYCPHIVLACYIAILITFALKKTLKQKNFEHGIIFLLSGVILISIIIETVFYIRNLGRTSIVLCTVFYYMYFQSEEYNHTIDKESKKIEGLNDKIKLDSMTGLLNKQAFQDYCIDSVNNNQSASIGFLFVDLDHFKDVNDSLGHITGDKAIKYASSQLSKTFNKDELICRFGGDEFCICMRSISYDLLQTKLNLLCKNIKHELWNENKTKSTSVTCSIGAIYSHSCINIDYNRLIKEADKAVYKAKNSGRNKYIIKKI